MKGRLYDPALRRFTTADPYVTEPFNPQGLNRYSYVQNNPMNATDPSGFQPFDVYSYSQQAWIQENIARSQFFDYLGNIAESGPATPPINVPSIGDIAAMNNADPTQAGAANWGQFNELANQASDRAMDQARAQQIQNGDAQRARDASFTQPFMLTPGAPMSYQTMMGFTGTTYGSNAYYPSDPIMNGYRKVGDFLLFDNIRTLADPDASTGSKIMAGVGMVLTFLPALKLGGAAAEGAVTAERLVIGRGADLAKPGALELGERALSWPSKMPNVAAEWKINSGLLRQEMGRGLPIRDASPGNTGGMFLNAERNLLESRGWTFNLSTNFWMPP
jgi:hypothetical protein